MELLKKHFDTAFTAPDGIKKLRELILTLAVRGELVRQNPDEQPVKELLIEIAAKKNKLVKEKQIRGHKSLPKITTEDIPYTLPTGWEWVRLSDVAHIIGGFAYKSSAFLTEGTRQVLRLGNIRPDTIRLDRNPVYIDESLSQLTSEARLIENDILITMTGTRSKRDYLYTARVKENPLDGITLYLNQRVGAIRLFFISEYIDKALRVEAIKDPIFSSATGSANQANVGINALRSWIFPLPPLAEQRRIVAKIDQLMARCDELEKLREARDRTRIKVHMAACDRLLTAPDTDTFTQSWQFITKHFSKLYSVKENVAGLRRAILQLAVMGRLVSQDPESVPASKLLDNIKIEKQRLIEEKRIKKSKSFPALHEQDLPYDLPEKWKWTRLIDLAKQIDYGTSQKAGTDSSQIPVYRMGNIVNGQLVNENLKYVPSDIDDLPRLYLRSNDILFNRTNSYELVGKTAIYFGKDETTTFASYLIRVRLFEKYLFPSYFSLAMNASYFRETQIEPEIVQQCGQANFNGTKLAATVIPLPPLNEQHCIVAKVNQLMTLCDTLEQQIDATTQKQTALLNAVTSKI